MNLGAMYCAPAKIGGNCFGRELRLSIYPSTHLAGDGLFLAGYLLIEEFDGYTRLPG